MPRNARIDAFGALHHIVIRGIERKAIFEDDADREDFIDRLSGLLQETVTPCYAWALMTNHVHLLMRTGNVPIEEVNGTSCIPPVKQLILIIGWNMLK